LELNGLINGKYHDYLQAREQHEPNIQRLPRPQYKFGNRSPGCLNRIRYLYIYL